MLSTGQGTHPQHNGQDLYHQNDENQMKRWWQESLSESIGLPAGYTKVSVLIIKWEEQLDQLQVDAEVSRVRNQMENIQAHLMPQTHCRFKPSEKCLKLILHTKPEFLRLDQRIPKCSS